MKFSDSGIIIGVKKYSESSLIVKVLSDNHGLYSGFIRGAVSSQKNRVIYQNFNLVDFEWSSRIADNLGFFKIELKKSFLGEIISSPIKLSALNNIASMIEHNVLEREPAGEIFSGLLNLLQNLSQIDQIFLKHYVEFEIDLLRMLGYGIDLSECAASGVTENLHFVSPKSARAVCFEAGEKYRDKLLALPQFLVTKQNDQISKNDLLNGLKLSGFFIDKYLSSGTKTGYKTNFFDPKNQLMSLVLNGDF